MTKLDHDIINAMRMQQTVVDSEQARVLRTALREVVNLVRRSRSNRFVPQAFLPLRNLPPPKVSKPK